MSWFRRFPGLSAFLGICLLAAIAFLVLVVIATGKYSQLSSEYEETERELARLESAKVYPSKKNVQLIQQERDIFAGKLDAFRAQLAASSPPVEPITPNGFQDKLRAAVSAIQKLAADQSVELPENFYLGFDPYQAELPHPDAAPILSRQLDAFQGVFERLIQSGVSKITFIERQPLPEEKGDKPPAGALLTKQTVGIGFISSPETFRQVVNAIASNKNFLVLRTLSVKNENPTPPSKADTNSAATQPTTSSTDPSSLASLFGGTPTPDSSPAPDAPRLEFIVGKEQVDASLQIEIIRIPSPTETSATPKSSS